MTQYINKDALVAEIESYISNYRELLAKTDRNDAVWADFVSMVETKIDLLRHLLVFIDTIEVKEIDFHKELLSFYRHKNDSGSEIALAKHFFELGFKVSNPITAADRGIAEEIITSLKQVENDYYLDQTKEIEWVRNKVKEGE